MCGETPDVGDRVVGDTINAFLEESLLSDLVYFESSEALWFSNFHKPQNHGDLTRKSDFSGTPPEFLPPSFRMGPWNVPF